MTLMTMFLYQDAGVPPSGIWMEDQILVDPLRRARYRRHHYAF